MSGGVPRVCVFARVPVRGRVKTRLAAELGEAAALTAHCTLVEHALARLAPTPGAATELWLDAPPDATCRGWSARWGLPLRRQRDGDLGQRMNDAFERVLPAAGRALVVGTDCPPLDAAYVARALDALLEREVVLGPAADGGYGLIGMRRPAPALFENVPWGTAGVLEATLATARAHGLSVALLPEIWDVDTAADWRRFQRLLAG